MWWEILPSYGIVMACMSLPPVVLYITNRFAHGTPYNRRVYSYSDAHEYLRDWRIGGDPYNQVGLENLK